MLTNRVLAELVVELHGAQKDPQVMNVLKLVDVMISETRIDNDTAAPDVVLRNQGKIAGLSGLKQFIERGLPGVQKAQ